MLSILEVRDYFSENQGELLALQKRDAEFYEDIDVMNFSPGEFLDWRFSLYKNGGLNSPFLLEVFMQVSSELASNNEFNDIVFIDNKSFTRVVIFKDLGLICLRFSSYQKHFLTEEEAFAELKSFGEVVSEYRDYYSINELESIVTEKYLPTISDFYGNFLINGVEKCAYTLVKVPSNLDLWGISLSGNDDFFLVKIFLSKEAAFQEQEFIFSMAAVDRNKLEGYYTY